MVILDVNVVLAAQRADHPQHTDVRAWFDALLAGDADFGVPMMVWWSFLRLTTNRRIFEVPTPLEDAWAFIDGVRGQPGHLVAEPGARHLQLLREVGRAGQASSDLTPDAVLAAIAAEHGAEIATLDRDFARFPGLITLRPGN